MKNRPKVKQTAKKPSATKRTSLSTTTKRKTVSRPLETPIPPILLEGDEAVPVTSAGPGDRYVLGRDRVESEKPGTTLSGLPDSYGTKRLYLVARDPHWLYAHWDLTRDQQSAYNRRAVDKHLILRIHEGDADTQALSEIHVHPESRNWFAHVGRASTCFIAVLGYYDSQKRWQKVATSPTVRTPPDSISNDTSFAYETLPVELRLDQVLDLIRKQGRGHLPLIEAIQEMRAQGHPDLPQRRAFSSGQWTEQHELALARMVSMDTVRRVWIGSLEITEWLREQLLQEKSSLGPSGFGQLGSWSGALSSPGPGPGAVGRGRKFWFNVNAELILYGATEPDALVTIGGRPIKLRKDGTFSFRFALPDGWFNMPAQAVSREGDDTRTAQLTFHRHTLYEGEIGQHPQDAQLKPPRPEHVA